MSLVFALAGNQNSGKTTLFNQLTGSNQHVGNFPGVTVEKKSGQMRKHKDMSVVDLPGIYSLSPYTSEEVVTRDFLINEKPDGIINIVDATNLERNLYLSLQLLELNIPTVIALNMMDEVSASGIYINIEKMEKALGVPIVPISASKNDGVDELIVRAIDVSANKIYPRKVDFCDVGILHKAIHSIAHLVEDHAIAAGIPTRFAATKMVEGDEPMAKLLNLHKNEIEFIDMAIKDLESELGTYRDAALADMRYDFIEKLCADAVKRSRGMTKEHMRSIKIDNILTHKYLALPVFVGIMFLIFYLTFAGPGKWLSDIFSSGIDYIIAKIDELLTVWSIGAGFHSLIVDGVLAGVGSVLSFLPTIVVLFFFLSLLEDSGYMARVAFVMDKLLRKIGLSGKSFVPMLIGFGCSVPAIMATRTLSSERDRKMTILLIPFMSCSAKMPIYAVFTKAFFPDKGAFVMIFLYLFGILMGIVSALILKNTKFKGKSIPFVMELPSYRFPSPKSVGMHIWDKAKDFLTRAFTVIFLATVVIWFLQSFDFKLNMVSDPSDSILAMLGHMISPLFAPLGFGDWRAVTSLLTGFAAKEAVVSTLAVLTGAGNSAALLPILTHMFSTPAAISFLIFTLLYTPCVAAIATVRRELGTVRGAAYTVVYQTVFAWLAAFCVYNVVNLFI